MTSTIYDNISDMKPADSSSLWDHGAGYITPSHPVPLYLQDTPLTPKASKKPPLEINEEDLELLLIPYLDDMATPSNKGRALHPQSILPNLITRMSTTDRHIKLRARSRPAPQRVLRSSLRQQPQPIPSMNENFTTCRKINHRRSINNADIASTKSSSSEASASDKLEFVPPSAAARRRRTGRKSFSALSA
jgi:hypothetical protein